MGRRDDDDLDDDDVDVETVLFQGALNGHDANLKANAKLARAGLLPSKRLISDALERRAEAIVIEPKGNVTLVRFVIDGVAYPGARMRKQQGFAISQMLKLLAGLDIQQRAKPQSGGIKAEMAEIPYHLLVESTPLGEGAERLTVRAKNLKKDFESPDGAGLPREMRTKIRELSSKLRGAILVCGPPNSGTTTTSYAVLRAVDAYMLSIFSIADMGDRDIMHVVKFEVKPDEPWEEEVARIERVETQVLFVDPIHNSEAARRMFLAAGKFSVIGEFTARDASHGLVQLCQWMGDAKPVAEGVQAVLSQKLVRLLCDDCKTAFRPNPKLLARLGLPPETRTLYRAVTPDTRPAPDPDDDDDEDEYIPCEKCSGLGYFGRTGLFEMIEMTEPVKQSILSGPDPTKLKVVARDEGMPTLQKAGLDLVAQGKTSLEELKRAFKT